MVSCVIRSCFLVSILTALIGPGCDRAPEQPSPAGDVPVEFPEPPAPDAEKTPPPLPDVPMPAGASGHRRLVASDPQAEGCVVQENRVTAWAARAGVADWDEKNLYVSAEPGFYDSEVRAQIIAVERETGKVAWRLGWFTDLHRLDEDMLVAAGGKVHRMDTGTGKARWQTRVPDPWFVDAPWPEDVVLVYANYLAMRSSLMVLSADTGKKLWSHKFMRDGNRFGASARDQITVHDGKIHIMGKDGMFETRDITTGKVQEKGLARPPRVCCQPPRAEPEESDVAFAGVYPEATYGVQPGSYEPLGYEFTKVAGRKVRWGLRPAGKYMGNALYQDGVVALTFDGAIRFLRAKDGQTLGAVETESDPGKLRRRKDGRLFTITSRGWYTAVDPAACLKAFESGRFVVTGEAVKRYKKTRLKPGGRKTFRRSGQEIASLGPSARGYSAIYFDPSPMVKMELKQGRLLKVTENNPYLGGAFRWEKATAKYDLVVADDALPGNHWVRIVFYDSQNHFINDARHLIEVVPAKSKR